MRRFFILFFILSFVSFSEEYSVIKSDRFIRKWDSLGALKKYKVQDDGILLYFNRKKRVKISVVSEDIIRVRFNKKGVYRRKTKSYAVIKDEFENSKFTVKEDGNDLLLETDKLTLKIKRDSFVMELYKDGVLIHKDSRKSIQWNDNRVVSYKDIKDNSSYYGFGEKSGTFDKKGQSMKMWNTDAYSYDSKTDPLYLSIPFFIERNKDYSLGLFFDNTYQTYFNMGEDNSKEYYIGSVDGGLDYYLIYGENSKKILNRYTELTGRMEMPPMWSLGFQQCRFSYYPESRVMEVAETFRKKDIPADVIYLDIDFMDSFKSFTWNKGYFPDPEKMISKLHEMGFKVITIIDPGIKIEEGYHVYDSGVKGDYFVKNKYGDYAVGSVWPGLCVFPDFSDKKAKKWWGDLYKPMLELGFDGFWNDMNEPSVFDTKEKTLPLDTIHRDFGKKAPHVKVHNVYGQTMIAATLEGLNRLRPEKRNFVLSRSGYAGIQRYAAVWTGDNTANWEHLKMNLSMGLNMGMSGLTMVGADVGGYSGAPSPELMTRWMQLGIFFPLYRNHTEKGTPDQEVWEFGEKNEKIMKESIELRYNLLQYLYDAIYESHMNGIPVIRPMFMEFENDRKVDSIDDQFMFGKNILVAPVLEKGIKVREVYLPEGKWYEYETNKEYEGGKTYTVKTPIDYIPIFVREGAIIPKREVEQYVGERDKNYITVDVYSGIGDYTLHLDDGESIRYKRGEAREIKFVNSKNSLEIETVMDSYIPNEEYFIVKIHGEKDKFELNGVNLDRADSMGDLNYSKYYYNESESAAYIKIAYNMKKVVIK